MLHLDTKAGPIPSVDLANITQAEFDEVYYRGAKPVIIRNSIPHWKANEWGPDYFAREKRNPLVQVQYNNRSIFNAIANEPDLSKPKRFFMPFVEAAKLIYSDQGPFHSVRQASFDDKLAAYLPDIGAPPLIGDKVVIERNLWFGGAGCKTPLHYDHADNFLVQVKGVKRVTLFAPDQTEHLYPALDTFMPHMSRVNTFNPDLEKFPEYEQAHRVRLEADIGPGDTLFMPPGWWHAVETIETSLSVNFWWQDGAIEQTPPNLKQSLHSMLRAGWEAYMKARWYLTPRR